MTRYDISNEGFHLKVIKEGTLIGYLEEFELRITLESTVVYYKDSSGKVTVEPAEVFGTLRSKCYGIELGKNPRVYYINDMEPFYRGTEDTTLPRVQKLLFRQEKDEIPTMSLNISFT